MSNSPRRSLPQRLAVVNVSLPERVYLSEVARAVNRDPDYLRDCIHAKRDDAFRRKRGIPRTTLQNLPLDGWQKDGKGWWIELRSLQAQLGLKAVA